LATIPEYVFRAGLPDEDTKLRIVPGVGSRQFPSSITVMVFPACPNKVQQKSANATVKKQATFPGLKGERYFMRSRL
jgi:hypothetical protein